MAEFALSCRTTGYLRDPDRHVAATCPAARSRLLRLVAVLDDESGQAKVLPLFVNDIVKGSLSARACCRKYQNARLIRFVQGRDARYESFSVLLQKLDNRSISDLSLLSKGADPWSVD